MLFDCFRGMPINAGYEYFEAEKHYLAAQTMDDKIYWLQEMIRKAPKHKSSENFLAELKQRLKKFLEKQEKAKKSGGGKKGIRKEGFQVVLLGLANSGKSSLLAALTNAKPLVTPYGFATRVPEIGTMDFEGVKAQVVDLPSIGSEFFDHGIVNTADCVLLVIERLEDITEVEKLLVRAIGKKIVVMTKIDSLENDERRKLDARLKSKKVYGITVSAHTGEGIGTLKEMIFSNMGMIRVFTKEPGKPKSPLPVVLKTGATVKDVAESIRKGFYLTVKETRLTGPSSKFANQRIGLAHMLKDLDVVEFHTR